MKICLMVTVMAVCALGQQATGSLTNGLPNGRLWKALNQSSKLLFVAAYVSGVSHAATLAKAMEMAENRKGSLYSDFILKTAIAKTMDNNERVTALDRFYDAPENSVIAIPDALEVVAVRASGGDEATIKKMISDLLKGLVGP